MEFFDLSSVIKDSQPIYNFVRKAVDVQRPKVPGYHLITKMMDFKDPAAERELYDNYRFEIPDFEDLEKSDNTISLASGAEDGVFLYQGAKDDTKTTEIATKVTEKVREFVEGSDDNLEPLYNLLVNGLSLPLDGDADKKSTIPVIGWFLKFMSTNMAPYVPSLSNDQLERYMKLSITLAFKSAHKTPVKVGLMMLGLGRFPDTYRRNLINMVMDLGRHEEFTWYSCRFLLANLNGPLNELWDMAIGSQGWGRIMAIRVCLLVTKFSIEPKEFKHWLLTRGYKNSVMIDYTAMDCIKFGDLLSALKQDKVEDDIMQGAYDLLHTVFEAGSRAVSLDIESVDDHKELIAHYKRHINSTPERKEKYTIQTIDD